MQPSAALSATAVRPLSMDMQSPSPYTIIETLFEGRGTVVLRAIRERDGRPVILKALDPKRSRPQDIERLKHEQALGEALNLPTVIRPLALDTYHGQPALVLEDTAGTPLDRLLGSPMETERFLRLAIRITTAVADIHRHGVVHKDIKPQNIIVNPATGEAKLTDFGIASRLPREHTSPQSPEQIEGSLPYMSPEQTGRMNRAVDSRTDLYSLGVTFYEMLTGRVPFEAQDPLEWIHFHLARVAPKPSEVVPAVPEAVARIVMHLLAKMACDRYQSARGVLHDLEMCLAQWLAVGHIEPFAPGALDVPDRLQISQKLHGREAEVAVLCDAFERVVATGTPELALVAGEPGTGKSALVHKLHEPVVRERAFFVSGKFDLIKSDIPYSTIVQAFQELVREILAESEERIGAWKQRLAAALGVNGKLIVDVIPQVELVLGEQSQVPALPPGEARNRFHIVFRQFIGVFAQREHPLVLFVDDMQWADSASLALLQDLLTDPEMHSLLVVGAYRNSEVPPTHPLILVTNEVRKSGVRVSDIVLGPLSKGQLAAFISDTLRCSVEEAKPLAELVHEKTAGNPFFVIQFLAALYEERLIEFDEDAVAFRWDVARIREKSFTDNVIDLMVDKLKRLPANTQDALTSVSCLGNRADAATLAMIRGDAEDEVHAALWEAVRVGLVLRLGDSYRFVHDRIQEAAYSLVSLEHRAEVHLRIGRLFLANMPEGAIGEQIFDIVSQLNRGVELITDPREKASLRRLNFQAAMRAKATVAHASARNYLAQATALLPKDAWSASYDETLELYLERSECEYLVGNFESADELFNLILAHARSNLDRAAAIGLRMRLYQVSGRYDDGVTVALEALLLFDVTFPDSDESLKAATEAEVEVIRCHLRGRRVADIFDAAVATDPDGRTIIRLLVEAAPCAYIGRPKLFPLLALKAVSSSLRYGNTQESCFAYTVYGMMLVSEFGDIPLGYAFSEMSLRLNEKFHDPRLKGTLLHLHGDHINFWRRPFVTGIPILERAFQACLEVGDLVYAGFLAFETVWQAVEKGDPLDEVLEISRKYAAFARQSHNVPVYETIRLERQFVACLKGATQGPTSFDDATFHEAACLAAITRATFGCGIVFHDIMKQITAFIHGRHAEALSFAARAAANLGAAMAMPIEATHHFFHALTMVQLLPDAPAGERGALAQRIRGVMQKLALWAENCPENYLNRYALVSAEVARVEGRDLDAMRLYEQAIRSARENGFVHNEGIANELASRFYRARGFEQVADTYLRDARACYARWGADGKVRQIDEQHPHVQEHRPLTPTATFALRTEQLDLLSVVKASQTISGEILLDELARTLLRVVLEEGGAQKTYLLLLRNGDLSIEAEARLEESGTVTRLLPSLPMTSSPLVPAMIVRYAQRTKERVLLDDATASKFAADPYIGRERPKSVLCMPILRQANVVGLLYLENNLLIGAFTPDRLVALSLLAVQAAISLQNARLLSDEQAARAAAEEAERRSAFVAEAGELLSESLDYEDTLERLGRLCVRSLADWCVIDTVEGDELRRIAVVHRDPAKTPLLDELQRRYPPRKDSSHPAARALATGEPILLSELSDERLQSYTEDETHARIIRALGLKSILAVPLISRGQTLGVLSLVLCAPGRSYGSADLELAKEVARRAASAIDNARLYRATQEAICARDEFLSMASHELNTPLTSLMLSLQSMSRASQSGPSSDPQVMTKLTERALRQGARLRRLNDDLLSIARVHTGQLPLELAAVDLTALVQDVVEQFRLQLSQARCSVSIHDSVRVVGHWDPARIEQIVVNLLSNATKFGAGKPIEIFIDRENGIARLAMKDHGIGIDPAQQSRIFERFVRAVPSKSYGGLGLGLYLSRKLAEAHGGSIRVQSEPSAGATFIVELPVAGPPIATGRGEA
ncbi:ATP-binding sensor histidine kinase [Polyangium sp. 6x1]|uniref:sensor histidine kinase n=1 Tax=Polyangium sp. 6x1 TaxID=3042689 RepID=UPI002482938A|nr:ATP-binding sensor histidine kinase [Polyangium sp. 6x1]MDI1443524.1 trifunctional serine/threonine-protein kinase/ATP-binding protein/sensor histidine kinase [Polyangium sp. 6x1]